MALSRWADLSRVVDQLHVTGACNMPDEELLYIVGSYTKPVPLVEAKSFHLLQHTLCLSQTCLLFRKVGTNNEKLTCVSIN